MNWKSIFLALLFAGLLPTFVLAGTNYEEVSFENLLSELSRKENRHLVATDPFEDIQIHAGMGLITSVSNVSSRAQETYVYQSGIQLALGIDLFSPFWMSEGTFRNYGKNSYGGENFYLKEFEFKLMFQNPIKDSTKLRFGGGLAARYLTIENRNSLATEKITTPDSVITFGMDTALSKGLSLGVDFSGRSNMTPKSVDRYAADMTVRLDTHF